MISKTLIHIVLFALLLLNACTKSPTSSDEDVGGDPNNEEELLAAFGADTSEGRIKVMSRNIYVGTDVTDLLGSANILQLPGAVRTAFNQLEDTDFLERAEALAGEIEKTLPHFIGLQEVAHVFIQSPGDFLAGNPQAAATEIYDYLQILTDALAARGLEYSVAISLSNADIELPMLPTSYSEPGSGMDDVRLIDRDAILVRDDITYSNTVAETYDAGIVIDETLGITVPRGYLSVDAEIDGRNYRFANTHLESFDIDGTLRTAQLGELLAAMDTDTITLILAGDFNFNPANMLYTTMMQAGYEDAWTNNTLTYNSNGYTYGHDSDLRNSSVDFGTRIDYIFTRSAQPFAFEESFVLGDELRDRTASNLWPSDHGGVVSKINFNR